MSSDSATKEQAGSSTRGVKMPPPYPDGRNPEVRGMKKTLMGFAILGGLHLWIIPGILARRVLRRWQRGEIRQPTPWLIFGGVFAAIYIGFWVTLIVAGILTNGFEGL